MSSVVWKYFIVDAKKDTTAKCNACSKEISRGGSNPRQFGTSGLKNHLKQHPSLYTELLTEQTALQTQKKSAVQEVPVLKTKQPTLKQCFEAQKPWDHDSEKAQRMHKVIAEMICIDGDAYNKVESFGFQRVLQTALPKYQLPNRKYFSDKMIPDIYERVKAKINDDLADSSMITCTSDLWTCSTNNSAFISLTAHYITTDFSPKRVTLHTKYFPGGHSALRIEECVKNMLKDWNTACYAIVTDNAANIVKAVADAGYFGIPCAAHTLQLAINEALNSQRVVIDLISNARGVVGHFAHSPAAYSKLSTIQEQLGLPKKKLIQDVVTRWNSTYYMLERIAEQRCALVMYFSEVSVSCKQLSNNEWSLLPKLIAILEICEMISKKLCLESTTASMIWPFAKTLIRLLEQNEAGLRFAINEGNFGGIGEKAVREIQQSKLYCSGYTHRPPLQSGFFHERADCFTQGGDVAFTGGRS